MKKLLFSLCFIASIVIATISDANAQGVAINLTGSSPDSTALLDIDATGMNPKGGLLIPRMTTTERNAIVAPANSLLIFNTTANCYQWWAGASWVQLSCAGCSAPPSGVTASATPDPICEGSTLTLTGGATGATSWSWTGPNGFTSSVQSPTIANISTAGAGVYTLTASNACGTATAVNTASVSVVQTPTTANAGADISLACGTTTTTLAGNTPIVGTGSWTLVSGTATITSPASPTSGVSGLVPLDTITLRWTISNGPCASFDEVVIITASCGTTMTWTDQGTGSCTGQMYLTMQNIVAAMPTGPINVRITAHQVNPSPGYGDWKSTFLNTTCVRQWLNAWATKNVTTYNNWDPAVCQATDTTGTSYFFVLKDAGSSNPQVAIYPTGVGPAQYMKVYLLDRTGAWCDLAGVNNRPGFDTQVTNGNTFGTSGDYLQFTWW